MLAALAFLCGAMAWIAGAAILGIRGAPGDAVVAGAVRGAARRRGGAAGPLGLAAAARGAAPLPERRGPFAACRDASMQITVRARRR